MLDLIKKASNLIANSKYLSAFTGAGISVESGIPPFRGENGLWTKYDPNLFDISFFSNNPEKSWKLLKSLFFDIFKKSSPNNAHLALAHLEQKGILKIIITQNIDNLHFMAGSKNIAEYHGNSRNLICLKCGKTYKVNDDILNTIPPRCNCGGLLKPDFVFFGEEIPHDAIEKSRQTVNKTDIMIVIGTTGEIYPASLIPRAAKMNGAKIIEVNTKPSSFTNSITDIFLQGRAAEVLKKIEEEINDIF